MSESLTGCNPSRAVATGRLEYVEYGQKDQRWHKDLYYDTNMARSKARAVLLHGGAATGLSHRSAGELLGQRAGRP